MNQTKLDKKIIVYRVDDGCEVPMLFDDVAGAIEYLKDCIDGIDFKNKITIEKDQMTRKKFESLPEF